jgi:L-ribulose-5-phosphate 3-epimerase
MNPIGIMQGRLSPPIDGRIQVFPRDSWADEFASARAAGLACLEWIVDEVEPNPLHDDEGAKRVQALAAAHGIAVRSLCADILMVHPFLRVSEDARRRSFDSFVSLMQRCDRNGIGRIVMPFVDASAITSAEEEQTVVEIVQEALKSAGGSVELHLELSLPPSGVASLLKRLPDRRVRVNYDSGNSASLGYDPREEFDAYGTRIGSVHIKDRVRGGGTVPLGEGDANLPLLFALLREVGYAGDLILQVARTTTEDEVSWARRNRMTVEQLLERA